ncbi:hypothetical protein BOTU111922_12110 [Bordetella tumulicola]
MAGESERPARREVDSKPKTRFVAMNWVREQ